MAVKISHCIINDHRNHKNMNSYLALSMQYFSSFCIYLTSNKIIKSTTQVLKSLSEPPVSLVSKEALTCWSISEGICRMSGSELLNRALQNLVKPTQQPSTAPWWRKRNTSWKKKELWNINMKSINLTYYSMNCAHPVSTFQNDVFEDFGSCPELLYIQSQLLTVKWQDSLHQRAQKNTYFLPGK